MCSMKRTDVLFFLVLHILLVALSNAEQKSGKQLSVIFLAQSSNFCVFFTFRKDSSLMPCSMRQASLSAV